MADEDSFLIKERSQALRKSSILSIVKEKEFQIKAEIVKVRQEAQDIVEKAKVQAEEIIARAEEKAARDAQMMLEKEIEKATNEASKVIEEAEERAKELNKNYQNILDEASLKIVSLLLGETEI
ncbi:MAG: hypothetical protein N2440_01805 [Actinobacteria bacterium]|nr:hypothetical protein [Actinomycetota bacterium]